MFCDIRGFTAFAERAEPEEFMALLRDYHAAMRPNPGQPPRRDRGRGQRRAPRDRQSVIGGLSQAVAVYNVPR